MTDLTLQKTRSLLDEIERRMGDDWTWEITSDEVDKLGQDRHGKEWSLARLPDAIDWSVECHSKLTRYCHRDLTRSVVMLCSS